MKSKWTMLKRLPRTVLIPAALLGLTLLLFSSFLDARLGVTKEYVVKMDSNKGEPASSKRFDNERRQRFLIYRRGYEDGRGGYEKAHGQRYNPDYLQGYRAGSMKQTASRAGGPEERVKLLGGVHALAWLIKYGLPYILALLFILALAHFFYRKRHPLLKRDLSFKNDFTADGDEAEDEDEQFPLDSKERDIWVEKIQKLEPDFSLPLFLGHARHLYSEVLLASGQHELERMKAYVEEHLFRKIREHYGRFGEVRDILIGSCAISGVDTDHADYVSVTLLVESNYVVVNPLQNNPVTLYEHSHWELALNRGSRPPRPGQEQLLCPYCEKPLNGSVKDACIHCEKEFRLGDGGWYLKSIHDMARSPHVPEIPTFYPPEETPEAETIFQAGLDDGLAKLKDTFPGFSLESFTKDVSETFTALQTAWSQGDEKALRKLQTESLFQARLHWLTRYRKHKLKNVVEDIEVKEVEPVKVLGDSFFMMLTVRIHAEMIDFLENIQGRLVGGDPMTPRKYTEYWTFVRCKKCDKPCEPGREPKAWVLWLIEPDDVYSG